MARFVASGSALAYSTFLGGAGADSGQAIAVDERARLASLTGSTSFGGLPDHRRAFDTTHNGVSDAFVTKLATRPEDD